MSLRFAMIGAGFWAKYQLAGWRELAGADCVAICDKDLTKAKALAERFRVQSVYNHAERMLEEVKPDFVDIVASPAAHPDLVRCAASQGIDVICQKPLAPSPSEAQALAATCAKAGVQLLVNENFRWQTPIRAVAGAFASGAIGDVFRARIQFVCSFPVFDNQPFLKRLPRFILSDIGVHILDVARFLFGEPKTVYAAIARINSEIQGEDVATVVLGMAGGATVLCEMSYASRTEYERFPETFLFVEGSLGSLELAGNYDLRITTAGGTRADRVAPPHYDWADPRYEIVHASIVDCQRNLLDHLTGRRAAETEARDNLRTLTVVEAAYRSAELGEVVKLARFD